MLKTDTKHASYLKPGKEYILLNEHLEHAMEREQLDRVIWKHNKGMHLADIAKSERRHPAEIFLALVHQSTSPIRNRSEVNIQRPFARII